MAMLRHTLVLLLALCAVAEAGRSKKRSTDENCPYPCRCRSHHYVECTKSNCLEKIPTGGMTQQAGAAVTKIVVSKQKDMLSIDDDELANLPRLNEARFYKNKLRQITNDAFRGSPNIQRLDLHSNRFEEVPQAIRSLSKLRKLNLGGNRISYVPADFFDGMTDLTSVVLKRNRIKSFPHQLPVQLNKISIDKNLIEEIPDLTYLTNLHALKAESNNIQSIQFHRLPVSLNELSLCYNNLSLTSPRFDLRHLTELRRLTLTDARPWTNHPDHSLRSFFAYHHNKLRVLSLRGMQIERLSTDFFDDMQKLQVVDISSNNLQRFDTNWLQCTPQLNVISIADNPWHCDCNLIMLLKTIKQEMTDNFDFTREEEENSKRPHLSEPHTDFDQVKCATVDRYFLSRQRNWDASMTLMSADASFCRPVEWRFKTKNECSRFQEDKPEATPRVPRTRRPRPTTTTTEPTPTTTTPTTEPTTTTTESTTTTTKAPTTPTVYVPPLRTTTTTEQVTTTTTERATTTTPFDDTVEAGICTKTGKPCVLYNGNEYNGKCISSWYYGDHCYTDQLGNYESCTTNC